MSKKRVRKSRSNSKLTSRHSHGYRSQSPSLEHFDVSAPLSSMISNHETLAAAAVRFVGWKNVESMLPPCLQGRSKDDVILLVADELDCMSKRRVSRILKGESALSNSSSSEESEEERGSSVNSERQQRNSPESYEQDSPKSSGYRDNRSSGSSHSEVDDNKRDRDYYSDIELVEGLDEEVENLPDVSKT